MTDETLTWLRENATGRLPLFLSTEIPDAVLAALRARQLALPVAGGVVVVRFPEDSPESTVGSLVWSIVEKIAERYAPAAVERDSAVRLYLGRTDPGPEIRIRQTGGTRWWEEIAPGVVLRVERGEVGETRIPVDAPEEVLLSLSVGFLREGGLRDVTVWLKSLILSRPALEVAYRRHRRPVVLKRMEHIARDAGNERLADMVSGFLRAEQEVRIGRDRTGVGRELIVPRSIATIDTAGQPWLDRLRLMIRASGEQVGAVLAASADPGREEDLGALLEQARAAKAYDAYHSTSIEGYRLDFDEVSVLLGGGDARRIEDARARLAIIGYGMAFDALLARIRRTHGAVALTPGLALDVYADLFTPSVEAGIVTADVLRNWRQSPVHIRGTLFVSPGPEKVPGMLDLLFEELAGVDDPTGLLRAILVHLWFVWIHPFPDGNGRVARFLMNAALLGAGLSWLTIRVERRAAYFEALRRVPIEEGYTPFARFILDERGGGSARRIPGAR